MSGALPTSPAFSSLKISSSQPTFVTQAISGRRQTRQIAGQRWEMTANFPPMTRAEFAPIYAFLIKQRGMFDSFTVAPPTVKNSLGTGAGTPLVNNAGGSQTGRSVITDGWSTGATVMKAGDFISFAGHTKIYMLTADATSDVGGNVTLAIEPGLVESPAENAVITTSGVAFTVALKNEMQEFALNVDDLFRFELDLEEAF